MFVMLLGIFYKSSINLLRCGGLLRDYSGTCLVSYTRKTGAHDYISIDLAWRRGTIHLQVESDSNVLDDMPTRICNSHGNILTLIWRICDLKNMNW